MQLQVSAPRNPSDTGSQEPDAQQGECFFSEEIQGGLQLDKIGSGDTDAVAGLAEDVVVDTPARDVALDNPGDCFVGAYQAAHDPQLLQHTLGRSLPSPQALPQVVDQMMANAELNTQTAVAVASLYKVTGLKPLDGWCLYRGEIGCFQADERACLQRNIGGIGSCSWIIFHVLGRRHWLILAPRSGQRCTCIQCIQYAGRVYSVRWTCLGPAGRGGVH